MKKISIAFDIDGTLRNNKYGYGVGDARFAVPNERIRTLLITLASFKNVECHIWSGGGKAYAEEIRRTFLLQKYVKEGHCHAKLDTGLRPDIAIDDIQSCELGSINLICREK